MVLNCYLLEERITRLLKETFIIQSASTLVIMPILAAEAKGDVDFATIMVTMTAIAYLAVLPLWSLFLFSFSEIIIYDNFFMHTEEPLQVLHFI